MNQCSCGSGIAFDDCCGQYISGLRQADTPEALMRSRYTAYTMANIPYIQSTMRGRAAEGYDPDVACRWAKTAKWLGLTVLNSYVEGSDRGFVEFVARLRHNGQQQKIHEKSEFQRVEGQWYYVDGDVKNR